MRFDNYADLSAYAQDVGRGGNAHARTHASSPIEQFIEALLVKLASGSAVDVPALAVRCQCNSPLFTEACEKTFDGLRACGAVSGRDARRVMLKAANDAWFLELHAQLGRLRDATPTITPLARR